jgi:uncharacterized protein (TIGR02246 family)
VRRQDPDDGTGPESVVDAFVSAWNLHDIDAFARLFTETAVWVPVAEARVADRQAIVADFEDLHSTWARTTTVAASDVTVRLLRPDVATVFFHASYMNDGVAVAGVDRAMLVVAVRDGGRWMIAAGQVTKEAR